MRVAVDLLGGDGPAADVAARVAAATARATRADPHLWVRLVGPPDIAEAALCAPDLSVLDRARVDVVSATQVVTMDEDPAAAVRSKRDATVRVACRLVRDGAADAMVSAGSTGAALAAALFTLGRLRGVRRPALALTLPSPGGVQVLLDAGAGTEADVGLLVQHALAGAALARAQLGADRPRVGLLSVGSEPGKGDDVRKLTHGALSALSTRGPSGPLEFIGNVEGSDVPLGGRADVIVTDGFTGNVVLKGIEGAVRAVTAALASHPDHEPPGLAEVARRFGPDGQGGAVLLGVQGVVVVAHGASSPLALAAAIALAAGAVRQQLVPRVAADLAASAELAPSRDLTPRRILDPFDGRAHAPAARPDPEEGTP